MFKYQFLDCACLPILSSAPAVASDCDAMATATENAALIVQTGDSAAAEHYLVQEIRFAEASPTMNAALIENSMSNVGWWKDPHQWAAGVFGQCISEQ
ncbi:hypothetical protein [Aliiroseovarius sp. S253]|uniref:hypothetical protein n=1 Tax=Aliiroseovarius sp. S253 TaxID=3415133 RepID=UPI003C7C74CF